MFYILKWIIHDFIILRRFSHKVYFKHNGWNRKHHFVLSIQKPDSNSLYHHNHSRVYRMLIFVVDDCVFVFVLNVKVLSSFKIRSWDFVLVLLPTLIDCCLMKTQFRYKFRNFVHRKLIACRHTHEKEKKNENFRFKTINKISTGGFEK